MFVLPVYKKRKTKTVFSKSRLYETQKPTLPALNCLNTPLETNLLDMAEFSRIFSYKNTFRYYILNTICEEAPYEEVMTGT